MWFLFSLFRNTSLAKNKSLVTLDSSVWASFLCTFSNQRNVPSHWSLCSMGEMVSKIRWDIMIIFNINYLGSISSVLIFCYFDFSYRRQTLFTSFCAWLNSSFCCIERIYFMWIICSKVKLVYKGGSFILYSILLLPGVWQQYRHVKALHYTNIVKHNISDTYKSMGQ